MSSNITLSVVKINVCGTNGAQLYPDRRSCCCCCLNVIFSSLLTSFCVILFHSKLSNKSIRVQKRWQSNISRTCWLSLSLCVCVCMLFQKGISFYHLFDRKFVFDVYFVAILRAIAKWVSSLTVSHLILIQKFYCCCRFFLLLGLAYATLRKLMCIGMCKRWAVTHTYTHAHTFKHRNE